MRAGGASPIVLAIDQGSSSTRCIAYDQRLRVQGHARRPLATEHPQRGWHEHDPGEIEAGVIGALRDAILAAGREWRDVAGIGIATQMESFAIWDRATGETLYPIVSWQCQRSAACCAALVAAGHGPRVRALTGLGLEPTFSASKLAWVLANVPGARARAARGDVAFGDVASWLTWRLSSGRRHVAEPSNACRSLLVDIDSLAWDPELLALFDVPSAMLPALVASDGIDATTAEAVLGARVPIRASLGDQPAALLGHGCLTDGDTALTLGTGAFAWRNAGASRPVAKRGVLAGFGWDAEGARLYAEEGFASNAGNAIAWLRQSGIVDEGWAPGRLDLASEAVAVPALAGLGSPHWDSAVSITLLGLDGAATATSVADAVVLGIVHQIVDAIEALDTDGASPLHAAGGLAQSAAVVHAIADLSGRELCVPVVREATARGIGWLTLVAAGVAALDEIPRDEAQTYRPAVDRGVRVAARSRWQRAVELHRAQRF